MTEDVASSAHDVLPLAGHAASLEHLDALVVFSLRHEVAIGNHVRPGREEVLGALEPLQRLMLAALACRDSLEPEAVATKVDVLVETRRHVLVLIPAGVFGIAFVFDDEAPLGLARGMAHQAARLIATELPKSDDFLDGLEPSPPTPRSVAPEPMTQASPARGVVPTAEDVGEPLVHSAPPAPPPAPLPVAPPLPAALPAPPPVPQPPALRDAAELEETVVPGDEDKPSSRDQRALSGERPKVASAVSGEWPVVVPPSPPVPASELQVAARRAVSFATANAPDPHVILVRLALRTGLGLDAIMHLDRLGSQGLALLETAIEDMFGIDRGRLRESRATSPAPGHRG